MKATAQCWTALNDPQPVELGDLGVSVLRETEVRLDAFGLPAEFTAKSPDAAAMDEARAFVQGLAARDAIAEDPDTKDPSKTHVVDRLPGGRRVLRRRGFN